MQDAVIVSATRTAVGKAPAGSLRTVRPDEQGAVQGALAGLQSIANILGPLIGTNAFAYFISDRAPAYIPGAPFYIGAILATGGWLLTIWALKRKPHAPDVPHFREQTTPPTCANCGYNIEGLTLDQCCPECGRALTSPRAAVPAAQLTDAP